MKRRSLDWFCLRFPRDLDEPAVLAALASLSGLPHSARTRLELTATETGTGHRLALNSAALEPVIAGLRAAMPSLRIEPMDETEPSSGDRLRLQLSPRVSAIRADDLGAISAGLLSALFPLHKGEVIRLSWDVRPGVRPAIPLEPELKLDGRRRVLRDKLAGPGLRATGELCISASSPGRRRRLMQRVVSTLRSLGTPAGRLVAEPVWLGQLSWLLGRRGDFFGIRELAACIGWPIGSPDIPGLELGAARRLPPGRALPRTGRLLGHSDFADSLFGPARPVALSAKASTRSLHILGPTGTGKSSLLCDLVPDNRVEDVVYLDLTDQTHAVGFNPFASGADPSLIADQLGELFQRLWEDFWGPRTARLSHMGLLTLARRKGSTLLDLPRLFQDDQFRAAVLAGLDDPVGLGPDWQWFGGLSPAEAVNVTSPLLNKARQWVARPNIRAIVGQARPRITMQQIIAKRKVLLVHLPKGLIGQETAQLFGCLVLTAAWQALAERTRLPPEKRAPFGVYVDEVQDFAAAPIPWDELFAQGRKYGCALTVAHQNLAQLPKVLREVILANARSKVVFTLGAEDARIMERTFAPSLSAGDLQALDAYAVAAMLALDDGSTARPVTLTTPPPPEPVGSDEAVRVASHQNYGRSRAQLEQEFRRRVVRPVTEAPIGRRKRSGS
ncbi:MAG TPA: type IV secretory system conjugative DNA transfer family protein [Solirubrobacterales bacterium]|nr:type IV secretory system conjugative DNA transfer family protein [Solirubrobacterales bacterium]